MAMISTHQLGKRFGGFHAVRDVSLKVERGEVLALLGPNGAGKTTTIRMLASILSPTTGSATIAGFDVVQQAVQVRSVVGLLTEHHGLYTRMRAFEYLEFFGRIYGLQPAETRARAKTLLERYDLMQTADLRLGQYSKGMRQKLALVRALLHRPQVLLMDEPTSAMDPESAHLVRESIKNLRSEDRAIVVCTHNLHEAEALADTIAIIRRGEIIAHDETGRLKRRLLGDRVMEVRLASHLDGALEVLPGQLQVIARGDSWFRYTASQPERTNTQVLQSLLAAGFPVVTLAPVERSLEEVYLRVVQEGAREEGRA